MIAKYAPATEERRAIAKRKIEIEYDIARAGSAEVRKERRAEWLLRQKAREHAAWAATLERKAANKAISEKLHQDKVARKIAAAANVHKHSAAVPAKK